MHTDRKIIYFIFGLLAVSRLASILVMADPDRINVPEESEENIKKIKKNCKLFLKKK